MNLNLLTFKIFSDPNVLSTVPPGSMENTHSNGGNSQGPETPAMVTDFSVTQMVEDILEHDQGRRGSWTGRGRFQEVRFEICRIKSPFEPSLPSMLHLLNLKMTPVDHPMIAFNQSVSYQGCMRN